MTSLIVIVIGFFMLMVFPKLAVCLMVAAIVYAILSPSPYAILVALLVAAIVRIILIGFKVK